MCMIYQGDNTGFCCLSCALKTESDVKSKLPKKQEYTNNERQKKLSSIIQSLTERKYYHALKKIIKLGTAAKNAFDRIVQQNAENEVFC